jgi:DNA-binding CsgD family transcriptional regulator
MKQLKYIFFLLIILTRISIPAGFGYSLPYKDFPEIRQYIANNLELGNQNWSIYQNSYSGKVYFGNSEGLYEYNGIIFRQYRLSENKNIRSVLVDKNGLVFTGAFEEFGFWTENEECELVYTSLSANLIIEKNDEIWRIYELNDRIYFQSFTSIYIYDYKTTRVTKSPFTMLFAFQVDKGLIAQVLENGLFIFEDEEFVFIEGSEIFNQQKIHAIIQYTEEKLLIATASNGLFLYDGKKIKYFDCEASDFLKFNTCNTSLKVNDSLLVFGTILNGIIITNQKGEILNIYNRENGLNNNTVLSLFMDMDNGLWIGLDEGINYIELASPYRHFASAGGTLGTIYAALKDKGRIYLGTNHGLFLADLKLIAGNYHFENTRFIENSQGHVWTLKKYGDQILCGHNEGTFRVKENAFEKISDITGGWTIKQYNNFLIEGSYTGIVIFETDEDGSWRFRNKLENFMEPVRHLETDYLGYIWASHHQKGLFKLELNEQIDSVINLEYFEKIDGMESHLNVFDINNRIVFTNGENIFTYNYVEKKIVPVSLLNKELGAYSAARQIIHFEKNLYWFFYQNKIALFEITLDFSAIKRLEIIQKSKGLNELDMHLLMLDDNNLFIPTRECFDVYNIGLHDLSSFMNRLKIEKLVFFGRGKNFIKCSGEEKTEAPWYTNNLTVYFSESSTFSQQSKTFYYRIPEIDERWFSTSSDNFTYLNLDHGNYKIEMKKEIGSDFTYSFQFTVNTPWYLTKYAIIAYVLLGILLLISIYKVFRYELNRQRELFEMEVSKENLESELDHKSYELMLTIRYLVHKNEILSDLQKEINDIKDHSSKYPVKNLRNMEKIISEGLDMQTDDWKNAMNSLKLSQQGFFKKLMEQFPELTPNDLRLCSYLRMNFSTKEIARLLNISARAVEISRYRLRKKMKLNHQVNLNEFLMSETFSESFRDQD